jgi:hypothetical protein
MLIDASKPDRKTATRRQAESTWENIKKALHLMCRAFLAVGKLPMIPVVGVEPTLPKEHDFESCASINTMRSISGVL